MINKISCDSSSSLRSMRCEVCEKTDVKLSKCSKCHFAKYCGTECQKKGWPKHKIVCNLIDELEKACKIDANPFLPNYNEVEVPKELKICQFASKLALIGTVKCIEKASEYIERNTHITTIREQFYKVYARAMLKLDKNNVSIVLEKGPGGAIRGRLIFT